MATKKASKKKAAKKAAKKKTGAKAAPAGCKPLKINVDGTTTPQKLILNSPACVIFTTPDDFGADITLVIELEPGLGGGVVIHS